MRPDFLAKLVRSKMGQSIIAFSVRIGSGLASYLLFAVAARVCGAASFGQFSILFSAAMMAGTAGSLGQQVFLVKEIPAAEAHNDHARARGAYAFSAVATAVGGLLGALGFAFASRYLGVEVGLGALLGGALLCLLYSISQTTVGALRVQGQTLVAMATRDLGWRVAALVALVVSGYFAAKTARLSAGAALGLLALSLAPIVAFHLYRIAKSFGRRDAGSTRVIRLSEWLNVSAGLTLVAIISSADLYAYTIALGHLLPPEKAGAFFASLKTVELLNLFLMAVTLVIAPELSSAISKGDRNELQRRCNNAILMQGIPAGACAIVVVAAAPALLWIYEPAFTAEADVLRLLAAGMLFNALTGATVLLLQLGGMHWRQVFLQGGTLAAALFALPLMVAHFGLLGAAASFVIAKAGWNVFAIISIRRKLGVDPSLLGLFDRATGGLPEALRELRFEMPATQRGR